MGNGRRRVVFFAIKIKAGKARDEARNEAAGRTRGRGQGAGRKIERARRIRQMTGGKYALDG